MGIICIHNTHPFVVPLCLTNRSLYRKETPQGHCFLKKSANIYIHMGKRKVELASVSDIYTLKVVIFQQICPGHCQKLKTAYADRYIYPHYKRIACNTVVRNTGNKV
jgi:hypothetical protein